MDYKSTDSRLIAIEAMLDHVESTTTLLQGEVNAVKEMVEGFEGRILKVEHLAQCTDDDLVGFNDDFDDLQTRAEHLDNSEEK